jgi:hypothetical protein
MQKMINQTPPDKWMDANPLMDEQLGKVVNKSREFETILMAELQTLIAYHVTQKGAYYTPDLVDRTEIIFPESIRAKIPEDVREEVRQSGRCLAFDNPTASGFHIIRAVEGVMHQYYLTVSILSNKW